MKCVLVIQYLWFLGAITDYFDFGRECDDSNFSLSIAGSHWVDLGWDGLLAKLKPVVFFHRSTHIYAEDDWNLIGNILWSYISFDSLCLLCDLKWPSIILCCFNLSCGLEDVCDLVRLRELFLSKVNFIAVVAEFTHPDLLVSFFLYYPAVLVEGSIASGAELCVSSHNLRMGVLEAFHWYFEDVRVKFHNMSLIWSFFTSDSSRLALIVTKIAIEVIWVIFFGWIVVVSWYSGGRAINNFLVNLMIIKALLCSKAEINWLCSVYSLVCGFFLFLLKDCRETVVFDGRHARRLVLLVLAS